MIITMLKIIILMIITMLKIIILMVITMLLEESDYNVEDNNTARIRRSKVSLSL